MIPVSQVLVMCPPQSPELREGKVSFPRGTREYHFQTEEAWRPDRQKEQMPMILAIVFVSPSQTACHLLFYLASCCTLLDT